jgi:hypothetical protein
VQAFRGAAEVQLLGDRKEVAQVSDLHGTLLGHARTCGAFPTETAGAPTAADLPASTICWTSKIA